VSGPETVGGGCEAALMGCSRRCREAKSSSCRCQCGGAGHGGGTVEDMPELNDRQFPEQFHVTTPANAEAIRAGGFALGGGGGYGKPTTNAGPGIYTASRHAAERWAGDMVSYNPSAELRTLPVAHDPEARIHTYTTFRDLPRGFRDVPVEEHLASHPDIAAHYTPPQRFGDPVESLAHATRKAGYDALHVDRGNTDETVWFDPKRLRLR
jgi:hypothetical protein